MPTERGAPAPTSPASARGSVAIASAIIEILASYRAASSLRMSKEPTTAPSPNLWRFSAEGHSKGRDRLSL